MDVTSMTDPWLEDVFYPLERAPSAEAAARSRSRKLDRARRPDLGERVLARCGELVSGISRAPVGIVTARLPLIAESLSDRGIVLFAGGRGDVLWSVRNRCAFRLFRGVDVQMERSRASGSFGVAEARALRAWAKRAVANLQVLVVTGTTNCVVRALAWEVRERGRPVVQIPHGLVDIGAVATADRQASTHWWVWSENDREVLVAQGLRSEILGYPFARALSDRPGHDLVFLGQPWGDLDRDRHALQVESWTAVREAAKRLNLQARYRRHPREIDAQLPPDAAEHLIPRSERLDESFRRARCVFALASTALVDARLAGIPAVAIGGVFPERLRSLVVTAPATPAGVIEAVALAQRAGPLVNSRALCLEHSPQARVQELLAQLLA